MEQVLLLMTKSAIASWFSFNYSICTYSFDKKFKNTFKHGLYNFQTVDFDIIKSINFDAEIPIINKKCPPITQKLCTFNFLNSHLVKYFKKNVIAFIYL